MKTKTNRILRKILSIALCLALVMSYVPMVSITASAAATDITVTIDTGASVTLRDADGDNYYDIGTVDELYAFAAAVNNGNNAINGELTADITVNQNVLNEDGQLNGDVSDFRVWTPIGNGSNQYDGTFYGDAHTITGLYFDNINANYIGLFGCVGLDGKVQGVGIIKSYFNGGFIVGGVVGSSNGTVINCYNTGSVRGNSNSVGGVIGYNDNIVRDCYNEGAISGGNKNAGGVVGYSSSNGTVTNCFNTGSVSGMENVGGVVGYNYSTMTNCYNTGFVSSNGDGVGGVVGISGGSMTNCYNEGTINGDDTNVGGVVGVNGGPVTSCYNEGTVIGGTNVGGVVGNNFYSNSTVTNCYNTGTVTGYSKYVGGVVGVTKAPITNCYNTGTITGYSNYVGGVVGQKYLDVTVSNCYYLNGCATDGNSVTQFGIGSETVGSTTADVTGQTTSKTDDWFTSGEVCTAVGYHCGVSAANGFCDLCGYDPATLNADGYYEISNGGQLFWFGNYINTVDRTANAVLTADIDLEGKALSPIGKAANKYAGVFDGQGHTISNFHIHITSVGNWGLFGYIAGEGTVIKNFSISGDVTTALTSNVDVQYGVVGQADGGAEIRNVHSSVNLTSKDAYQKKYFGGIVGRTGNITVDSCSFSGKLSLDSNTLDCVGGIAGYVYNGKTAEITNCGFYGDIDTTYSGGNVGGILGYYNGENAKALTVSNCLSVGTLPEGRNAIVGTLKNYGSTNAGSNNYYLDGVTNSVTNVTAAVATQTQLASGEIAIALGDVWGQMSNTEGSLPIITYNELYKVVTVGETGNYSVANVGDTNSDGTVDVTDYQALVNKALADDHEQIETASYDDIVKYDLDGDGYLDVIDAYLLHLFINGFTTVDVYAVGDYDLNGVAFEEADIKAIKHAIENPEKLATYKKYASDINGDGKLDENDLTALTAKYGEVTGTECADNVKVYYRWGNKYSTCTATAMCTLCGEKVATETVNTTSETLSESTCTQDGKVKYTATFQNELLGTKTIEIVKKATGHSFNDSGECICGAKLPVVDLTSQIEGGTVNITGDCRIIGDGNEYNISLNIAEDATVIFEVGASGVKLNGQITVADGKTLTLLVAGDAEHTVNGGISLGNGSNVIIEGDLTKANNKLTVSATDGNAGIGANGGVTAGDITIRNARVDATGSSKEVSADSNKGIKADTSISGAAIGTSDGSMGDILIENSIIVAEGGYYESTSHAAAIGIGYVGSTMGDIILKNSQITARNNGDGLASVIGAGANMHVYVTGTLGDIVITNTDLNLSMAIGTKNYYAAMIGSGIGHDPSWVNMGKIIFTDTTQAELDEIIPTWLPSDFNQYGAYALGRGYAGEYNKHDAFGGVWVSDGSGGSVQIGDEGGYHNPE